MSTFWQYVLFLPITIAIVIVALFVYIGVEMTMPCSCGRRTRLFPASHGNSTFLFASILVVSGFFLLLGYIPPHPGPNWLGFGVTFAYRSLIYIAHEKGKWKRLLKRFRGRVRYSSHGRLVVAA